MTTSYDEPADPLERPSNVPEGSVPVVCWLTPRSSGDDFQRIVGPSGNLMTTRHIDFDNEWGLPEAPPVRYPVKILASAQEVNDWYNELTALDTPWSRRLVPALMQTWRNVQESLPPEAEDGETK